MKKVIFISALAIAAAVSCTKSDIVDTKFNEQIGFENYLGRPAQTKASVATTIGDGAGIYGFYTAGTDFSVAEGTASEANLWWNHTLTSTGSVSPEKFWTNDADKYTFLAYAPVVPIPENNAATTLTKKFGTTEAPDGSLAVPTGEKMTNPTITYNVPAALANQVDLLWAAAKNVTKKGLAEQNVTKVPFQFHHALARLTVNASESTTEKNFDFIVKKIEITGGFITEDVLTLADGKWKANSVPVAVTTENKGTTYSFYNNENNPDVLSQEEVTEYAKVNGAASNYLMMIPVNFANQAANLHVEYTTVYQGEESTINKADFAVDTNFEQGKAYAINLVFSKDAKAIEFTVSVENWQPTTGTGDNVVTDEIDQNESVVA